MPRVSCRGVCCYSGWQHHPVARKFHFIIPVSATREAALAHGNVPALLDIWLQTDCQGPLVLPQYLADDAGSPYIAPISIFDSTSHLLHGVLHANGFGHLLRINGVEGGSQNFTGELLFLYSLVRGLYPLVPSFHNSVRVRAMSSQRLCSPSTAETTASSRHELMQGSRSWACGTASA